MYVSGPHHNSLHFYVLEQKYLIFNDVVSVLKCGQLLLVGGWGALIVILRCEIGPIWGFKQIWYNFLML